MPFVQRMVEPVFVSRRAPNASDSPDSTSPQRNAAADDDFGAVSNLTLGNVLRQLAAVVLCADQILGGLGDELFSIQKRTESINKRIKAVGTTIEKEIHETIICE